MVYQILISAMYLYFSNFFLVFIIVGLVGEAVVIAKDLCPSMPALFLSPTIHVYCGIGNIFTILGYLCARQMKTIIVSIIQSLRSLK